MLPSLKLLFSNIHLRDETTSHTHTIQTLCAVPEREHFKQMYSEISNRIFWQIVYRFHEYMKSTQYTVVENVLCKCACSNDIAGYIVKSKTSITFYYSQMVLFRSHSFATPPPSTYCSCFAFAISK